MPKINVKALKANIESMEKRGEVDTMIVGSDIRAEEALEALKELGRDFHVIVDDEISPSRFYLTSQAALQQFPGGGRN